MTVKYMFHVKRRNDDVHSKYSREFQSIENILSSPPTSWKLYDGVKDGLIKTIEMEFNELMAAHAAGNYEYLIENLNHVAAACVKAHNKMTCEV